MTARGAAGSRIHLHTLGCPKNEADSGRLARRLTAGGLTVSADAADADVIVVNTCGFIQEAIEESIDALLELTATYPEQEVVAYGCLVERHREELVAELPEVGAWFGLTDTDELTSYLGTAPAAPAGGPYRAEGLVRATAPEAHGSLEVASPPAPGPGAGYAYVKISDGCDHRCSFCAIPAIKGAYRALSPAEILEQARAGLAAGAGELVLVGQDTTLWRSDGWDLPRLVEELAGLPGTRWIRLLYLQPEHVDEALLELVAEQPSLCRYLDIPLQHVSRPVLRSMGRWGDGVAYRALFGRARALMPDVSLRSTFIAGYPGETEGQFEELLEFIGEVGFDHAGVFPYSAEEGTRAAALPGRLPPEVVAERLGRLSAALNDSAEGRALEQVGSRSVVLLDRLGPDEGDPDEGAADEPGEVRAVGRMERQAPEVDGVVFVRGTLPPDARPGGLLPVSISESRGVDLFAEWDGP